MTTHQTQADWDAIVQSQGGHPLQLSGWGEVKESTGSWQVSRTIHRDQHGNITNFAQILIRQTPLGKFGYIPRDNNLDIEFLNELRAIAKREDLFMLRFEPNITAEDWRATFHSATNHTTKLKTPRDHILLARTAQLDLTKPSDELLAAMRKQTRYEIRRGERDPAIKIRPATKADLPRILEIYHETAKRSQFPLHPDEYYQSIFDKLGDANHIFVAEISDSLEAFLWCIKSKAICIDLYAGSTELGLKHLANYTLKWQTILAAQATGCKTYDLNGLLNDGLSRFKLGFTGDHETLLAPTSDLVIKPLNYFLFVTLRLCFQKIKLITSV